MKKLKLEKFFNESATISVIVNGIRLQKQMNKALSEYALNLNQALILMAIFFEPEKLIRSQELINLIPTTKGNISHCTSSLEAQKLIIRNPVENDLRGFEFSLTAKGHKTCLSLVKFFDEVETTCDKQFSAAKLKEFISTASKI
jgi:DNA-binding MarR family transcriptional regulator